MSTTANWTEPDPTALPPRERCTVAEFLERPAREDGFCEELIEGEIYVSPNAKPLHNETVRRLERLLQPLEGSGFIVLGEVACRLSEKSLPNTDVAVIQEAIWSAALQNNEFIRQSPALVVEVHSPNNRQLQHKAALYLEGGAEQVWIVYPNARRVRVLMQEDDYDVRSGETLEFAGLRIACDALFGV